MKFFFFVIYLFLAQLLYVSVIKLFILFIFFLIAFQDICINFIFKNFSVHYTSFTEKDRKFGEMCEVGEDS